MESVIPDTECPGYLMGQDWGYCGDCGRHIAYDPETGTWVHDDGDCD